MHEFAPKIKKESPVRDSVNPLHDLYDAPKIQPRLEIGKLDDKYEIEADEMADSVVAPPVQGDKLMMEPISNNRVLQMEPNHEQNIVRMIPKSNYPTMRMEPAIQKNEMMGYGEEEEVQMQPKEEEKKIQMMGNGEEEENMLQMECEKCEQEEVLQRKLVVPESDSRMAFATSELSKQVNSTKGQGQYLPGKVQREMGNKMGADFSKVNIHTDSTAVQMNKELGAEAFTHGKDIYFNNGNYNPNSDNGKHLLAHELTHTVQQGKVDRKIQPKIVMVAPFWHWPPYAETELDEAKVVEITNDTTENYLKDIIDDTDDNFLFKKAYRKQLIVDIILDMHQAKDKLYYNDEVEFVSEVKRRVLTSLYMRSSQGSSKYFKAFGYPNRGTAKNCDARVNKAAKEYWGPVQSSGGSYFFELSAKGKDNGYEAVKTLFEEQKSACDRTLIHCDYLISVIHFRVFAETLGINKFNEQVKASNIPITLKWNGFTEITENLSAWFPDSETESLINATISDESDLIIGDHVVFYNHESYDSLNSVVKDPWRLENAILTDRKKGKDRFQGHGYFSPKYKDDLIASMMSWYNRKVTKALAYAGANDITKLNEQFPSVKKKDGKWIIRYQKLGGHCTDKTFYERPLEKVKKSDYPNPFAHPCDGKIYVRRPMESLWHG